MLIALVGLYLLGTIAIGFWAARRVKNTTDFVVAGRKLPLVVASSALFATWFGSETIMGAPSEFVEGGALSVIEDPFGAAMCLILAGLFVARPLYRLNLLTFNDFYRERFGRLNERVSAIFIVPTYLGWIAAQMVAMAILLNVLLGLPIFWGVMVCLTVTVIYTTVGGMWAVSVTDFVQTAMIIIGVLALAISLSDQAGGFNAVIASEPPEFFSIWPERSFDAWVFYIAAWITLGLGSIAQQDVFQRFMSARSERTAMYSGVVGGMMYLTIGMVPLFIGLCARVLHPELLEDDPQKMLPQMVMQYGGLGLQVMFFGAVLSAILSTTSGAILAPATVIGENLIKPMYPGMSDAGLLRTMRVSVLGIAGVSAMMALSGAAIYDLVGTASSLALVSLFVPLIAGLYWKRANGVGALLSMLLGMGTWLLCEFVLGTYYPSLIYGFLVSVFAMIFGSLASMRHPRAVMV